jgi:membrane-bound metal-dependent hydrolase YbcI (DUF457 family)
LAAVVADLLFWLFILLGIEHVRVQPGITATNALDLYDIPISQSLLMDTLWATLLGATYFFRHRHPRGAWVVFIAVLSHWLLDFVSHRADMPLAPTHHQNNLTNHKHTLSECTRTSAWDSATPAEEYSSWKACSGSSA